MNKQLNNALFNIQKKFANYSNQTLWIDVSNAKQKGMNKQLNNALFNRQIQKKSSLHIIQIKHYGLMYILNSI